MIKYQNSLKKTSNLKIGGKLVFLMMLAIMLTNCRQTLPVSSCHIDTSLVVAGKVEKKPKKELTNGDLVTSIRTLNEQVIKDNERKKELIKQIYACSRIK